jgi:hypothetical protein
MVQELGSEMAPETAEALEKVAQRALAKALELQKAREKE